jgi:hypothetical protein
LIHHFQGRVSCPYGQTAADIGLGDPSDLTDDDPSVLATSGDWEMRCRVPGTTGRVPSDRVTVPVRPQKVERRSTDTVYCSCRCGSPEGRHAQGNLCTCPNGYECVPLIGDLGLAREDLAGSYCVKVGTEYNEAEAQVSPACTYQPSFPGGADEHPNYCGEPVP